LLAHGASDAAYPPERAVAHDITQGGKVQLQEANVALRRLGAHFICHLCMCASAGVRGQGWHHRWCNI